MNHSHQEIRHRIYKVREQQVMLDSDLAEFYKVPVKQFNQAVNRNRSRFPENFMFQLTQIEYESLRFVNKADPRQDDNDCPLISQFAISNSPMKSLNFSEFKDENQSLRSQFNDKTTSTNSIPNMNNYSLRSQFVTSNSPMKSLNFSEFKDENQSLRSQFNNQTAPTQEEDIDAGKLQIPTSGTGRGGRRYLPLVFTEQGVAMLSAVLKSDVAIQVSIAIMETFVQLRREKLAAQNALADQLNQFKDDVNQKLENILAAIGQLQKVKLRRPVVVLPTNIPSGSIEKMRSKITAIQTVVAKYFCLTVEDLQRDTRRRSIALPRQITIYLARQRTDLSLKEIAFLYGKDHSTIIHACEKIETKIKADLEFKEIIQNILESLP